MRTVQRLLSRAHFIASHWAGFDTCGRLFIAVITGCCWVALGWRGTVACASEMLSRVGEAATKRSILILARGREGGGAGLGPAGGI